MYCTQAACSSPVLTPPLIAHITHSLYHTFLLRIPFMISQKTKETHNRPYFFYLITFTNTIFFFQIEDIAIIIQIIIESCVNTNSEKDVIVNMY